MNAFETAVWAAYLLSIVTFVGGLHLMNSPATARAGNLVSIGAMTLTVAATIAVVADERAITATGIAIAAAGVLVGGAAGLWLARAVAMTAMPELVSLFNAVGGAAAALIAVHEFAASGTSLGHAASAAGTADILIGGLTFAGSLVAAGKLHGVIPSEPLIFPGRRSGTASAGLIALAAGIFLDADPGSVPAMVVLAAATLGLGTALVLPIGGADMPVVISLLNAFTGTAVAMAGFLLGSLPLIAAGALVGASGTILTRLMAAAMNRHVLAVVAGGYGTGSSTVVSAAGSASGVRQLSADDVAIQLAYAAKVIIVPGYGLAAAQAQHEVAALTADLQARGVDVAFAIHPVAGRMPGHMNVLLAEANVAYPLMLELGPANAELPRADVALVIGANDVTNPAARRPGNAVSGMPILDVDHAAAVVVIKRSLGHGYAGIDNELYTHPRTGMFFADARQGVAAIRAAIGSLVN